MTSLGQVAKVYKANHRIIGDVHILKKVKKNNPYNISEEELLREPRVLASLVTLKNDC